MTKQTAAATPTATRAISATARIVSLALLAGAAIFLLALASGERTQAAKIKPITKAAWLPGTLITEYYPARESWFSGRRVSTPGIKGRKSKVDWLYSAVGMSMEGDGIGTDGRRYHISKLGNGGWVGRDGRKADWSASSRNRTPFWRAFGYWQNAKKRVTFPLDDGTWYAGTGKKWVKPKGVRFARGASLPLKPYRSVATDTRLIPRGSLVWIGRYKSKNGDGWFRAEDTGGALSGRHIDVYRKAPREIGEAVTSRNQRIYVVPKSKVAAYVKRERAQDRDGLPLPPASLR